MAVAVPVGAAPRMSALVVGREFVVRLSTDLGGWEEAGRVTPGPDPPPALPAGRLLRPCAARYA